MMPKQSEIELPLLQVLAELPGGEAKPGEIYPLLEKRFPALTKQDRAEQLESGGYKWFNRVQWVRQSLITRGEMFSPRYGVWAIRTSMSLSLRTTCWRG